MDGCFHSDKFSDYTDLALPFIHSYQTLIDESMDEFLDRLLFPFFLISLPFIVIYRFFRGSLPKIK
jgi:hypothetical protein